MIALTKDDFHVHQHRVSQDCDGRYERTNTFAIPHVRGVTERDELWEHLIAGNLHTYDGRQQVCIDTGDQVDERSRVTFDHATDEGYEHIELNGCTDPFCNPRATTYRDHTAERMGY